MMLEANDRENRFFELATIGAKTVEEAFKAAYSPKDRKTLMTLIGQKKKNNPGLFQRIADYKGQVFEKAKDAQQEIVVQSAKKSILSAVEKRELLRKMIEGELVQEEIVIVKNRIKKIKRKPTNYEKIRAIQMDNAMAGHNAPTGMRDNGLDPLMELLKIVSRVDNEQIPNVLSNNK